VTRKDAKLGYLKGERYMFTRKFKVPDYEWEVEMFEPTMAESEKLAKAYDARDWSTAFQVLATLIKSWNCTDKKGVQLSIDADGVAELPLPVLRYLVTALYDAISVDSKLKNPSSS
jgi:hypothetical protein